jgi:hypothetical protein
MYRIKIMEEQGNVEIPTRRGYPWWGWLIAAGFLIPLVPMLAGVAVPQSRRYLRFPGICIASIAIVVVIAVLGTAFGGDDNTDVVAPPQVSTPSVPTATTTSVVKCPTTAEADYFVGLADIVSTLATAISAISRLSTEAGNNPVLTLDETWQLETAVVLVQLRSVADEIDALNPPDSVQSIHDDQLQIAEALREFVTLYTTGVDNLDADLIVLATKRMAEINQLANAGSAKISAFCQ